MKKRSLATLGMLSLLWGSSFLFIKVALEGLSPIQIVLARMVVGAVVLLAFVLLRGLRLPQGRALWGHFTVAAVIANIVPYFLFAWGEQTVPSNVAGSLNATTPLFTVAIGVLANQEGKGSRGRLAGLVLGFAGAIVVLAPWSVDGVLGTTAGQLACLAAAASYAVSYVYIGRFLAPVGLPSLVLSACQLSAAAVLLLIAAPFVALDPLALSPSVIASVLALGVLGTGVAYILNYRLITDEGPTAASIVSYLLPVVSVVLGVLVLAEPLTWNLLAGGVLVLAGVAMSQGRLPLPPWASYSRSPGRASMSQ